MQEIITLSVFVPFAVLYMRTAAETGLLVGCLCMVAAEGSCSGGFGG